MPLPFCALRGALQRKSLLLLRYLLFQLPDYQISRLLNLVRPYPIPVIPRSKRLSRNIPRDLYRMNKETVGSRFIPYQRLSAFISGKAHFLTCAYVKFQAIDGFPRLPPEITIRLLLKQQPTRTPGRCSRSKFSKNPSFQPLGASSLCLTLPRKTTNLKFTVVWLVARS